MDGGDWSVSFIVQYYIHNFNSPIEDPPTLSIKINQSNEWNVTDVLPFISVGGLLFHLSHMHGTNH